MLAIIGILVSILLPKIRKARKVAELTVCATNLKQLGNATALHLQDNNGFYPNTGGAWSAGQKVGTQRPLMKYLNLTKSATDGQILRCPDLDKTYERHGTTYATNLERRIKRNLLKKVSLAQINNVSTFVIILPYPGYFWLNVSGVSSHSVPTHGLAEDKRWNLLFADQHVSYQSLFGSLPKKKPNYTFSYDK